MSTALAGHERTSVKGRFRLVFAIAQSCWRPIVKSTSLVYRSFLAASLLSCIVADAQDAVSVPNEGLQEAAEKLGKALLEHDFLTVAALLPQKIVDAVGGPESAQLLAERIGRSVELKTIVFRPTATACTALSGGTACVLQYRSTFVAKGVLMSLDSFYVAWHANGGFDWRFADGSGFDNPAAIRFLFPDFKDNLVFPPRQARVEAATR